MIYAGIGSRETPTETLQSFRRIAKYMAQQGHTLRTGGARGADNYFELGCDDANGKKEIYLPWANFENRKSKLIVENPKAFDIAKQFHPAWDRLSVGAKKLQARNTHQILGWDLETPSDLVICYTKNGSGTGGTGQAIRLAKHYGIKIIDAGSYSTDKEFRLALFELLRHV